MTGVVRLPVPALGPGCRRPGTPGAPRREAAGHPAMHIDLLLGCLLTSLALLTVVGLYVWSSRIIDRIHERKLMSLRQIRRELRNGE